jgi:hypothetical protein
MPTASEQEEPGLSMVYDKLKGEWIKATFTMSREAQNAMQIAGIKGRFAHLDIEWTHDLEQQARKRDGGGITQYLETIAAVQEEAREKARKSVPGYGVWE